jgi:hypothetical protein
MRIRIFFKDGGYTETMIYSWSQIAMPYPVEKVLRIEVLHESS